VLFQKVIPMKMGIQIHIMCNWIPACACRLAGMTSVAHNLTGKISVFLLNQPHFYRKIYK